jgi:hypothetical protein
MRPLDGPVGGLLQGMSLRKSPAKITDADDQHAENRGDDRKLEDARATLVGGKAPDAAL